MFKSKLQEYCQIKAWGLPEYSTTKEGYDHSPRFKASVIVNGATYTTPDFSKSSKIAQNFVAKLAFEHVTGSSTASPASLVSASSGAPPQSKPIEAVKPLSIANPTNTDDKNLNDSSSAIPASLVAASSGTPPQSEPIEAVKPLSIANPTNKDDKKLKDSSSAIPASLVAASSGTPRQSEPIEAVKPLSIANPTNRDDKKLKDMARLYKNQLQIYAQKRNLNLPVYVSEREGPPHAPRFKSKVMLEGKTYECQEHFCTVKDAENAAAKIALMSVSPVGTEEEDPGFFKNLLQELAQKDYSCLPEYSTNSSGPSHSPVFVSTVEIKDESFIGQEAKTKKLAEMYAAKVAYSALKERAHRKASEFKHVIAQPEGNQTIDQNTYGQKVEELPFQRAPSPSPPSPAQSPSTLGLGGNNKPWAGPHASSVHKKVKVFPRVQNMTLPPDTNIKHEDEKWVAVSMDSIHGNA